MKSFFKTLLASTVGIIIGGIFFSIIAFFVFIGIVASAGSSTYILQENTVLKLELKGSINEQQTTNPLDVLFGDSDGLGLDDILDAIKKAKENDKIKGIYIKGGIVHSGIATTDAIRKALIDFKESGKFVVAYADIYGQDVYYLSSVADKVIMNPKGLFEFQGLSTNIRFTKNFYDKIGVKYQVFKVGTFKSAVEPVILEKMSEPNRLQIASYLGDVWGHLVDGISQSRNIPVDSLNRYADEFLLFSEPESIVRYGLVDTLMYEPAVDDYLKDLVKVESVKEVKLASVKDMTSVKFVEKKEDKNRIAVLIAEGNIVDDQSGGFLLGDKSITAKQFVKELNSLKEDDDVKAVVFRVNSRGGSAYASEQIWNAVVELKAKKPVVVSMGDYAASGGYYISCGATSIVAEPTTLTGSIGIFGLIPNGEELAKKMGYTFDEVSTNKNSSWGGKAFGIPFFVAAYSRGLNENESRMLQAYIERGYDLFITRCADGRSKTKAEIDSIGQGRVWTGNQALKLGLVDKLGDLNDAVKIAAEKAGIDSYSVDRYPEKKTFFAELMESSMTGVKNKMVKMVVGEAGIEQQQLMNSLNNMDVRMAVMPDEVNF